MAMDLDHILLTLPASRGQWQVFNAFEHLPASPAYLVSSEVLGLFNLDLLVPFVRGEETAYKLTAKAWQWLLIQSRIENF